MSKKKKKGKKKKSASNAGTKQGKTALKKADTSRKQSVSIEDKETSLEGAEVVEKVSALQEASGEDASDQENRGSCAVVAGKDANSSRTEKVRKSSVASCSSGTGFEGEATKASSSLFGTSKSAKNLERLSSAALEALKVAENKSGAQRALFVHDEEALRQGISIELRPAPEFSQNEDALTLQIPSTRMGPVVLQFSEMVYLRTVMILAGLVGLLWLIYHLRSVVSPVLFALALAYLINPLVGVLQRGGLSRQFSISLLVVVMTILIVLFILLVFPALLISLEQLTTLVGKVPEQLVAGKSWLQSQFNVKFPSTWAEVLTDWGKQITVYVPKVIQPMTQVLTTIFSSGVNLMMALFNLILVPLFTFYFLKDYNIVRHYTLSLIPPRTRPKTEGIFSEIDKMVSGFIRGQITVSLVVGLFYFVLLSWLNISMAPMLALIGALINVVPYLGFLTIYVTTMIVALLDMQTSLQFWGVCIGMGAIHMLDVVVITPRIVGDKVGLSELVVIIAILAGGKLFGLVGIFLAVPVAAVIKVLMKEALLAYRCSKFYNRL